VGIAESLGTGAVMRGAEGAGRTGLAMLQRNMAP
jgi:hypothetical protein